MKQLTRIRLVNWHLFEDVTIPCQGTTYFIGVNGVGKSTILDAIQFALVGGQRDVRFNRAAMSASRRTLAGYVRGELGTEEQRFLRSDATAVVALEFRNPDGSHFAHGAVIDAYADNRSPDIAYFIVHNAPLNDAWFFHSPGQLFDSRAFCRHMDHFALPPGARAQTFARLEDYRFHLLNRLGQLKETFPAKIVKGLAFSPLTNIRDFVHEYLLDENLVDVKALQDQLETMRHFETLAADVRQRIAALERIEALDQERSSQRRLRLINGYAHRRAQSDDYLAALKRRRLELDQKKVSLGRLELERDALAERLSYAQQALIDAEVTLRTDTTATREQALRVEIAALSPQVESLRQREQQLRQRLDREHEDALHLAALLAQDDQPVPSSLTAFVDEFPPCPSLLAPHPSPATIHTMQSNLETLGRYYAGQQALVSNQCDQLQREADELEREIQQLRTGDRDASYESAAPQAAHLRRLLRAELDLPADQVIYLCTVLRVPDETWQDAVEGILGRSRFDLLVPSEHYDAAMRLYHRRRHKDNLHGVGLLDTEMILCHAPAARAGSLAEEVETDHAAARTAVDLLLGGYAKCDDLEALRDHPTAVTRDCFVRRAFTARHLDPAHYRHWFVGERAVPRQIERREERLEAIRQEMLGLQAQDAALCERLSLTRDKVRCFIELEHDLPILVQLPEEAARVESLREELDALDLRSIEALRAEVGACRQQTAAVQQEMDECTGRTGSLQAHIETLETDTLPNLERQADLALQDARQLLSAESAESLAEEAELEYERRRQRQPVETVRTNAARYESDYQAAENRSRDRLREAKQSYSLTYQFGYDDDEDAARYTRERERYIESELPEYETRIAEQRALAEQELVENFIHRLREQIEDARQQLAHLNMTLSGLRFGGERFEFVTRPEPMLRQVYEMIMDSQAVLGKSLFESDFRQRHQQGWDLLFERLTAAPADEQQSELRALQDYRNYLHYDIRIHYPNGDRAWLSKIKAKKSGGETTTPFYVAMAASFAQAYRLNQPRPSDTIRLALFDEAFGKMDGARTASALQFMVDCQLQVVIATPPDKAAGLLPYVDSVRTVVRKNNHAFVIEIDKAEMLKELESA